MPERRITIEEEELSEYVQCSLRHLYRYRFKVEPRDLDRTDLALKAFRASLLWFYGVLALRSRALTLRELLQDFERRVAERTTRAGFDLQSLTDQIAVGRVRLKRHFGAEEKGLAILGAEVPYERVFKRGDLTITLKGRIDLVRVRDDHRPKSRSLELIHISTGRWIPPALERANTVPLVCARLGFATLGNFSKGRNSEIKTIWYSAHQDREVETEVREHEMRVARGWLLGVAEAIEGELYYPQFEQARCTQCPYRKGCDPGLASGEAKEAPLIHGEELSRKLGLPKPARRSEGLVEEGDRRAKERSGDG